MRRKKPRAGDVWLDHNDSLKEIIILLRLREGVVGRSVISWELLVTRADGTTYIDWEDPDHVQDWYLNAAVADEPGLRRIV